MYSLAWILGIGLLGPILSLPKRLRVPVAFGEILAGVIFGKSGFDLIPVGNSTFSLFSSIGFALVMMIAGSNINTSSIMNLSRLRVALARQLIVSAIAVPLSLLLVAVSGVHHFGVFLILLTSSSAALVLPVLDAIAGSGDGTSFATLITQVSIADLISILLIPLVLNRRHVSEVVVGSLTIAAVALLFGWVLYWSSQHGYIGRMREVSKQLHLGLELRISLILLLILASIAIHFSVSVMIAGFTLGLALSFSGVPHRLARQLFAVSEGFFAPFFFVWLGAGIDVRAALSNNHLLLLTLLLTLGTWLAHTSAAFFGQTIPTSILASTQLGVPTAIVAIGQGSGLITAGQAGAIMLAALLTIVGSVFAAASLQSKES